MQAARRSGAEFSETFTEKARRAQIVEAAIATIAEVGYQNASFTRIAKQAGLSSTGVISYHFAGKRDLIREVVASVIGAIGEFMAERLHQPASAAEALETYIRSNAEFTGTHRREMKALLEVFLSGGFAYGASEEAAVVSPVEAILRAGQESGEFRRFDPKVMATLVQRAVDGLPFLLATDPGLDVAAYGDEVATAFRLATRAQP